MDRTQAFVEYGRILKDSRDWLNGGYRRPDDGSEIAVPPLPRNIDEVAAENTSATPGDEHRPRVSPSDAAEPKNGSEPRDTDSLRTSADTDAPDPEAMAVLGEISAEIAACRNCNLYLLRQNTVPGIGPAGATLMVVTPPPADLATESMNPLPVFEQEYLGKWLSALGLNQSRDVFITPAVKCRTPGGRPPLGEEAQACSGYLRRQYKAVAPRAILALGGAACGALTGDPGDFPALVGRDWTWGAIPALVLWTPSEVLANPGRLRKPVWDSLQRLKAAWNAVPGNQL